MNRIKRFETNLYVSKSDIQGEGLFSKVNIPAGKIICQIADLQKFDNTENWINEWGHKINHSDTPTAVVDVIGNKCFIKSIELISPGEEITTDYRTIPDYFNKGIYESINLNSLKWYNESIVAEIRKVVKLTSWGDNEYNKKEKDFYYFHYRIGHYDEKMKKQILDIIKKWKSKLLRQYIILTFNLDNGGGIQERAMLTFAYKDLYRERVKPRRYVYHTTHYLNRDSILEKGLIPKPHSESEKWKKVSDLEYPPAIFAVNGTNTWEDGDIWQIDTSLIKNMWYEDLNIASKNKIMTFEPIPKEAIKLIDKTQII